MFIGALAAFLSNIFYELFAHFLSCFKIDIFNLNYFSMESPTSDSDPELDAEVLAEAEAARAEEEAAQASKSDSDSESEANYERDPEAARAEADARVAADPEGEIRRLADAIAAEEAAREAESDSETDEAELMPSGTTWIWPEGLELPAGGWSVTGPGPWPGSLTITKD